MPEWSGLQKFYSPRIDSPLNPLQLQPWKIIGKDKPPRKGNQSSQRTMNKSIPTGEQTRSKRGTPITRGHSTDNAHPSGLHHGCESLFKAQIWIVIILSLLRHCVVCVCVCVCVCVYGWIGRVGTINLSLVYRPLELCLDLMNSTIST